MIGENYTVTDTTLPVPTSDDSISASTGTAPAATTASRTEKSKDLKDESITTAVSSAGSVKQAEKTTASNVGTVSAQSGYDSPADTPENAKGSAVTQIPSENYPNGTDIVTTTAVPLSPEEYERSFIMKI